MINYLKHYASTLKHKFWVAYYMVRLYPAIQYHVSLAEWVWRALRHDWSKFTNAQARDFAAVINGLGKSEYGSPEYKANVNRPGIKLHVRTEDHHPQYWRVTENEWLPKAFDRMPKIAQREMICDWAAAVRRNPNGSLITSIFDINKTRLGYDEAEACILLGYAVIMGAVNHDEALYELEKRDV